jgi:hypothetical protein
MLLSLVPFLHIGIAICAFHKKLNNALLDTMLF